MRRPRVRFTVRGLMVAVAVAGGIAWGVRLRQLAAGYRGKAADCQTRIDILGVMCYFDNLTHTEEERARARQLDNEFRGRWYDHWTQQKAKYDRAARYPWLPVEPDPPPP